MNMAADEESKESVVMCNSGGNLETKPRSVSDLKAAREARAAEALKLKDEQLRILSEQNKKLIDALDKAEGESSSLQMEKLVIDDENRNLRESNFEALTRARAAEGRLENLEAEYSTKDKQLRVLSEQNGELLRHLEIEEAQNAQMASNYEACKEELSKTIEKHRALVEATKSQEQLTEKANHEEQLRTEEVRLLRSEIDLVNKQKGDLDMKTSIELESLQEQLRVRKEKQYQLLEKMQNQEEAKRKAEDRLTSMEERIRTIDRKANEAETQLQIESKSKLNQEAINRKLVSENQKLASANKEINAKWQKTEQDRLQMEAEARESGEQLREMAEKVFQLLERLKLSELGKTRSMEAMRTKEQEVIALKKKNTYLSKEVDKEGKIRVKAELSNKDLQDQIRALKKHNSQLGQRCKEEAKAKIKEEGEKADAQDKVRTLNSRLTFLLNKLQSDEDARKVQREEIKKMESQMHSWIERCESLQAKVDGLETKNRQLVEALSAKQEELQVANIRLSSLQRTSDQLEEEARKQQGKGQDSQGDMNLNLDQSSALAEGRLRFFVDSKSSHGCVVIKAKRPKDREWLESKGCNQCIKRAVKHPSTKELLVQKIAELFGIYLTKEEEVRRLEDAMKRKDSEVERHEKKYAYVHNQLTLEEETKRKCLLKYINAVKASVSLGEPGCEKAREDVGFVGSGRILLSDSNLTDEDVHMITSSLKKNVSIIELGLRGNAVTDDGARAIATILASSKVLRTVDLRGNKIGRSGLRAIVDGLERSERVRHVYVRPGGKVEALSGGHKDDTRTLVERDDTKTLKNQSISVETICVVDVRDNDPPEDPMSSFRSRALPGECSAPLPPSNSKSRTKCKGHKASPERKSADCKKVKPKRRLEQMEKMNTGRKANTNQAGAVIGKGSSEIDAGLVRDENSIDCEQNSRSKPSHLSLAKQVETADDIECRQDAAACPGEVTQANKSLSIIHKQYNNAEGPPKIDIIGPPIETQQNIKTHDLSGS